MMTLPCTRSSRGQVSAKTPREQTSHPVLPIPTACVVAGIIVAVSSKWIEQSPPGPLSIFDLIITHKLTRPIQKQKLRGKEKRNRKEGRKEGSRCKPGRNKKSDMLNLEIAG